MTVFIVTKLHKTYVTYDIKTNVTFKALPRKYIIPEIISGVNRYMYAIPSTTLKKK